MLNDSDRAKYFRLLFDKGDQVCLAKFNRGTSVYSYDDALSATWPVFASVNPIKSRRLDKNVTAYRNFVIEMDTETLKDQAEILSTRGVPYATLTYSGGKSLHAVISLHDPFETEAEYRAMFQTINDIIIRMDPSCKNPSRLTRIGGAIRQETGVEQKLIDTHRRISRDELVKWTRRFHKHLSRMQELRAAESLRREERVTWLQENGISGIAALEERDQKFLQGEWSGKGSRHNRLVYIAHQCLEQGVEYAECLVRIQEAHHLLGIGERAAEALGIVDYVYFGGSIER